MQQNSGGSKLLPWLHEVLFRDITECTYAASGKQGYMLCSEMLTHSAPEFSPNVKVSL